MKEREGEREKEWKEERIERKKERKKERKRKKATVYEKIAPTALDFMAFLVKLLLS